jgi:hypothetical protein
MKQQPIRTLFLIFLFTAVFILIQNTANAQQVVLSLTPPIVEALIKPGKSILIGYTFQNQGDPTAMSVKMRTFSPKGDYGEMSIDKDIQSPVRFSLDNTDMQFDQPFFMRQRDTKQALVRIRVPENTPEGDYYFVFLAETEPVPSIGGTTNSLAKASIGSTLLLTVTENGMTEVKSRIALFNIVPDFTFTFFGKKYNVVESSTPIPVHLIIQNQGKNLIKPQGAISLRGGMGQKTEYPLIPQNILTESSRLIKATGGVSARPEQSLVISGYHIGAYSLSASVSFGENTPQLFANTSFIALPLRFLIVLASIVFASVLIVGLMRKKKK